MAKKSVLELQIKSKKTGAGTKKTEGELRRLSKASGEAVKSAKKLSLGYIAAGVAIAAATVKIAKSTFEMGKHGAGLLRLEKSGQTLAANFGQSMDAIVNSMSEAAGGTISNADAMAAANRALQLGVAKTPEEFEKLTKASIALGRAMGRGPNEAIEDIIGGIGRMSPLILDNLGIVGASGAYDEYAERIGKSAKELTEAEKKQALLNKAMKAAEPLLDENGNLVGDMASKYEQLTAKTQDAKDALSEYIAIALTGDTEGIISLIDKAILSFEALALAQEHGVSIWDMSANKMDLWRQTVLNLQSPTNEYAGQLEGVHYYMSRINSISPVKAEIEIDGTSPTGQDPLTWAQRLDAMIAGIRGRHNIYLDLKFESDMAKQVWQSRLPEFQFGGHFIVPPGFEQRSMPIGVHSGEEVNITPASQVSNDYRSYFPNATLNMQDQDIDVVEALASRIRRM